MRFSVSSREMGPGGGGGGGGGFVGGGLVGGGFVGGGLVGGGFVGGEGVVQASPPKSAKQYSPEGQTVEFPVAQVTPHLV